MKTDEELDKIGELLLKDPVGAGAEALLALTSQERARMMSRAKHLSEARINQIKDRAEADGSMDKMRAMYANDLNKKQPSKRKRQ